MLSWTKLGAILTNSNTLPIAGYVILYSDYFQSLFKFSSLTTTSWGFLSFWERVNLIYGGSLALLFSFGLWWLFSPPRLRGKRDLQHFASDIVVARDRSSVFAISKSVPFTLGVDEVTKVIGGDHRSAFERAVGFIQSRGSDIGEGAGEYEDRIPTALGLYFMWQDVTRPFLRIFIACFTLLGYGCVLLPAIDLFLRVLGTHYHRLLA